MSIFDNNDFTECKIKNQKIDQVFSYYDEPRLYSCWLSDGARYLVLWVEDDASGQLWLYAPIREVRYEGLLKGIISLYSVFKNAESNFIYKVNISRNEEYKIKRLSASEISDEMLPDKSCYLVKEQSAGKASF